MGMDVDEARGDDPALGVDLFGAGAGDLADRGDLAVLDRDIALEGFAAGAVDDRRATDHNIEIAHRASPLCAEDRPKRLSWVAGSPAMGR